MKRSFCVSRLLACLFLCLAMTAWSAWGEPMTEADAYENAETDAYENEETAAPSPELTPAATPDDSEIPASPAPEEVFDPGTFGLGGCLGMGAGLAGFYAYLHPNDVLGLEAAVGARLFLYERRNLIDTNGNSRTLGGTSTIYWPVMGTLKCQFYFNPKSRRFRNGIELGVMAAEDTGLGGEASWIMHLRLVKRLYLDGMAGLGFFPDIRNQAINYLVRVGGGNRRDYENMELLATPVILTWGVGLSFMF